MIGIIAEYNPFHNGHEYHINEALRCIGDDTPVLVVMSGNFVQRAETAICDKFARAQMAIACGADLVVELPVAHVLQSAEGFARGAVAILHGMGAEYTAFGVECGNMARLVEVAEILKAEPDWYKTALKAGLDKGLSFPAARARALCDYGELAYPNNILAIEYIKAGAPNPVAIGRTGVFHDSDYTRDGIASASYIRRNIGSAGLFMPYGAYEILDREMAAGRAPVSGKPLGMAIMAHLRRITPEELREAPDVSEGLENRIISASREHGTLEDVVDAVKTKRYTHSRIRRAILASYLGLRANPPLPDYIMPLAMTARGKELLKRAKLPVVMRGADKARLNIDLFATDIYSLLYPKKECRKSGADFRMLQRND